MRILNETQLQKAYRELNEDFPKIFFKFSVVMIFVDSDKIGTQVIVHQLSKNFRIPLQNFSDNFMVALQ